MTSVMSYGLVAVSGMIVASSGAARSTGSSVATNGAGSRLFCGRYDTRSRTSSRHSGSESAANWHTPDLVAWL